MATKNAIDSNIPIEVSNGGSGAATFTDHGVLVGSGTSAFTALTVGTDGQVLLGSSAADPVFATLTSSGSTIAFTPGAGTLNLETGTAVCVSAPTDSGTATPAAGALTVAGGTNINTAGAASTVTVNLDTAISGTTSHDFAAGGRVGTATGAGNTLLIQAYDVDGAAYATFATLTANNTPTMDLDDAVTKSGQYIYRASGTDVPVADGGTGASTLTDHGILVGSGTSAVTALTVGGTGELLVGSAAADPAFGTSADGNFTFGGSSAGGLRLLRVENTSNTASSAARLSTRVAGSSASDPYIEFSVSGVTSINMGLDNDDSDSLKIDGGSIGSNTFFKCTTAGEITKPLQPAFLAYLGTEDTNVTGDGTAFTLGSGNALTEVFDQNSDFNTNGTFTAPVTGRYLLAVGIRSKGYDTSNTDLEISIVTSNGTYDIWKVNPFAIRPPSWQNSISGAVLCDMDASDTATVVITCSNGSKVVDIQTINRSTYFSGHLVC